MIKEAIEKLMQAENLTYDQVKESVDEIMTGQASPALIASFLTALSIKGETDEEIAGAAESMRSKALPLDSDGDILDIVGTGGDKSGSFNISTTAGIIAAAAGVRIAKHGNLGRLLQERRCRLSGGTGRQHQRQQRDDGACPAGGEHLLHVRPKVPQRHEICGAGTPGTGHSHHF